MVQSKSRQNSILHSVVKTWKVVSRNIPKTLAANSGFIKLDPEGAKYTLRLDHCRKICNCNNFLEHCEDDNCNGCTIVQVHYIFQICLCIKCLTPCFMFLPPHRYELPCSGLSRNIPIQYIKTCSWNMKKIWRKKLRSITTLVRYCFCVYISLHL